MEAPTYDCSKHDKQQQEELLLTRFTPNTIMTEDHGWSERLHIHFWGFGLICDKYKDKNFWHRHALLLIFLGNGNKNWFFLGTDGYMENWFLLPQYVSSVWCVDCGGLWIWNVKLEENPEAKHVANPNPNACQIHNPSPSSKYLFIWPIFCLNESNFPLFRFGSEPNASSSSSLSS
jgi:hypothetical protein